MSARESSEKVLGEIRNSLDELRTIIDTIPALAWSSRPDSSVDFVNQRWQEYTGLSPEQSYGASWHSAIHPQDLPGLMKEWEKARDRFADVCEVRLPRFDGVFRWFSLRREPLVDDSDSVTRWVGEGIDIDAIKQRETLHAAEKRTLELIADGASLKDVLDQLCSSIDVQVAPSVTTVLLRDPDQECLWHGGGLGVPHEWISAIIPVPIADDGLCGRAAYLKERLIVPDVATDPKWPDQYRDITIRNGIRAAWSEPIVTKDDEVLGTFALYSHELRVPTEEDLALIQGAGHIARIAIERQRSQESLTALEKIKNPEARLRQVIDTIPTLAWCNQGGSELRPACDFVWIPRSFRLTAQRICDWHSMQILAHNEPALIDVKVQQLALSISRAGEGLRLVLVQPIVFAAIASPSTGSLNFYWDGDGINEDGRSHNR